MKCDIVASQLQIGRASGKLRSFIVEPFVAHEQSDEAYVCIYSHRKGDTILFTPEVIQVPVHLSINCYSNLQLQ